VNQRPRIGITTSLNEGEQRLDRRYVESVRLAGGLPLIVPMTTDRETLLEFAKLLDGLVVTGGPAIVDGLIGELPSDISLTDPVRIEADKTILGAFLETRRPVLGICYGMQLLNAVRGGTIFADFSDRPAPVDASPSAGRTLGDGHTTHAAVVHSSNRGGTEHIVQAEPGSRLAEILGSSRFVVNTRHIQAVAAVGAGLKATLYAEDGCIEGIEDDSGLILGVQFHPERMGQETQALFETLVESARQKT